MKSINFYDTYRHFPRSLHLYLITLRSGEVRRIWARDMVDALDSVGEEWLESFGTGIEL